MPQASCVVDSRKCDWFTVLLREDGILVFKPEPGSAITQKHALEVLELGLQIAGGRTRCTLVLMQDVSRVNRDARACFASAEYLQLSCRTALVVGSPVSRVIGSFFVGLNRLKYPCKIFDDPELAVAWLLGADA